MVSSKPRIQRSNETEELAMTHLRRYHERQQKAKQRRLEKARERLQREQGRAQRHLQALEQAVQELGLPETVAEEVQWRLQAQQRLLGKIFGMMFPPAVWLPQRPRAVPGPRLGQEPPWPGSGRVAQTEVGQALATPGSRAVGTAVAAGRGQESGDPQSVAVDVGRRRQPLQEVWPATGPGGDVVERSGAPGPAGHRWPA